MKTQAGDAKQHRSCPELEQLQSVWHRLRPWERGLQLRRLTRKGWKRRELARILGVTEGTIRYDLRAGMRRASKRKTAVQRDPGGDRSCPEPKQLRSVWHRLRPAERGVQLQRLLEEGWQGRRLARELGVTEGTIRYDLRAAKDHAKVAESKDPPDPIRPTRPPRMSRTSWVRMATEEIVDWFDAEAPRLTEADRELLFAEVRSQLHYTEVAAERSGRIDAHEPHRVPDRERAIQSCRPRPDPNSFWMADLALWLARCLWHLHPSAVIRDSALERAERILGRRSAASRRKTSRKLPIPRRLTRRYL